MITDFSAQALTEGVMIYPVEVYEDAPTPPDEIGEVEYVTGSATGGRQLGISATADRESL
jgi:hypothetical protein